MMDYARARLNLMSFASASTYVLMLLHASVQFSSLMVERVVRDGRGFVEQGRNF